MKVQKFKDAQGEILKFYEKKIKEVSDVEDVKLYPRVKIGTRSYSPNDAAVLRAVDCKLEYFIEVMFNGHYLDAYGINIATRSSWVECINYIITNCVIISEKIFEIEHSSLIDGKKIPYNLF